MKLKIALIIASMAGGTLAPGQTGFIVHFDSVQAGKSGTGLSVREVDDGYLVFCRQIAHSAPNAQHIFTRKISLNGAFQQEFEIDSGVTRDYDIGYTDPVATLSDGTFASTILNGFNYDGETWFYKFNSQGDTIMKKFVTSFPPEDSVTHAIRQARPTSDGGFILCGFYANSSTAQAYLIRLNSEVNVVWTQQYGLPTQSEYFLGVEEYPDGGFVLSGYRTGAGLNNKTLLMRINSIGQVQWTRYFGAAVASNTAVKVTPDGNIVTWSSFAEYSWPTDTRSKLITKWSPEGDIIWQKKTDSTYYNATWDLEQLVDGSFIGTGYSLSKPQLCKFNSAGDSLWSRTYTVTNDLHFVYDVEPTSDGGFVATGLAYRYIPLDSAEFHQSQTIFVIKTDSLGCVIPGCHTVGVEEYALDMNEHLTVFPNPVAQGGSLSISFNPPPEYKPKGPLRVVVLDAMGRRVFEQPFTNHPSPFTNLQSGMYYLHLTDGAKWLAGSAFVVE